MSSLSRIKCIKKHKCFKDGNIYKLCVVITHYETPTHYKHHHIYFVYVKSFIEESITGKYLICSDNYQECLKIYHDSIGFYY